MLQPAFALGPMPPFLTVSPTPYMQTVGSGGTAVYDLQINADRFSGRLNVTIGSKLTPDLGGANFGQGQIPTVEPLPAGIEANYSRQILLANGTNSYFLPVSVKVPLDLGRSTTELVILVSGSYRHEYGYNETFYGLTNIRLDVEPKDTTTTKTTATNTTKSTTLTSVNRTASVTTTTTQISTTDDFSSTVAKVSHAYAVQVAYAVSSENQRLVTIARNDSRFNEIVQHLNNSQVERVTQKYRVTTERNVTTTVSVTVLYPHGYYLTFMLWNGSTVHFSLSGYQGDEAIWFENDHAIYRLSFDTAFNAFLNSIVETSVKTTTLTSTTTVTTSTEKIADPSTYAWAVGATVAAVVLAVVLLLQRRSRTHLAEDADIANR